MKEDNMHSEHSARASISGKSRKQLVFLVGLLITLIIFSFGIHQRGFFRESQNQANITDMEVPVNMSLQFLKTPELGWTVPLELKLEPGIGAALSEVVFEIPTQFELVLPAQNTERQLRVGHSELYVAHVRRVRNEEGKISATVTFSIDGVQVQKRATIFVGEELGQVYVDRRPRKRTSPVGVTPLPPGHDYRQSPPKDRPRSPETKPGRPLSGSPQQAPLAPGPGQIVVWGYWNYLDRFGSSRPIQDARVEIWDEGVFFDTLLDTRYTSSTGYFESQPISNSDDWITKDIYVKVFATDDYSVNVTDVGSLWDTLYGERTSTVANVGDGYVAIIPPAISDPNRRPAYFIYDKVCSAPL